MSIEKLDIIIQKTLPLVYDDSLSYLEFLAKVVSKVNEAVEELNIYLNQDLRRYVEEKLIAWKDDGTLDTLIADAILDIGNRQYSQNNYVADGESLTDSIDALDVGVAQTQIKINNTMNNIRGTFAKRLANGDVTGIKLVGDSITVGVGATGGGADPNGRIILSVGGTDYREGYQDAPVWSNFFRNYINNNYPGITFLNNGIGGWSVSVEGLQYTQEWVRNNNDVVFVMLGTNDRQDATSESDFEQNLTTFLNYVESTCNTMVVMSPPPALNDYLPDGTPSNFNLKMENIDKVITKVCLDNGWEHISFYREFLKYVSETNTPIDYLLQSDGWFDGSFPSSHPVDSGYRLMWLILQQELGLITNTVDYALDKKVDNSIMRTVVLSGSPINPSNPIDNYRVNHNTHHLITTQNPYLANFPEFKVGTLITHRPYNDLWAFQTYTIYDTGKTYKRIWQPTPETWGEWRPLSAIPEKAHTGVSSSTPITEFYKDSFTYTLMVNANPDIANFPGGAAGTLITFRPRSDSFSYQEYTVNGSVSTYKRYWTGSAWSAWTMISAV